jgi:hypothetical protein
MGNARDKKDRDVDFNGNRAFNPAHPTKGPDLVRLDDIATGAGLVKASGLADATHGATFSPAVAGVDFAKVSAFEGADRIVGTTDTLVLKDTVANLAALTALGVGTGEGVVHNGSLVWVRNIRRAYRLDTTNAATADGFNVVTAATGRWIAQLGLDAFWLSRTDWWVDPANGAANDENDGQSAGAPLKTFAELTRRLIGARLTVTVTVHVMSSSPSSDVLQLSLTPDSGVSPAAYLIFRGARTSAFSGAITAYTPRDPTTNGSTQMTLGSLPTSWTASDLIGKRVEWTDTTNYRTAWALADLGGKTARLSIPTSTNVASSTFSSGAIADFTVGQTVNVYNVPTIGASAVLLASQSVLFQDLNIATFEAALGSSYLTMGVRFIGSGQVNLTNSSASYIATKFDVAAGGVNSQFFFGSGCVLGNPGTNHFNLCNITGQNGLTIYRLSAAECGLFIGTDLEHFFPAGTSDNVSQFVLNFPDPNSALTVTGNVYGDAVTNLVTFDARARNCSAMFGVMPTIGTYVNSGVRSPVGASNSLRYFLASDLALTSFMDEYGNEVVVSYLGTGSGPVASARTLLQTISARIDAVPGLRHTILREQTSGVYTSAKADSAANATGALAAVVGSQEITGANVYCLAAVAGRPLVQFDGTPTLGAMAYLSPTTDGYATTTFPAVSGTNQMRALGLVVATSGTLGLVEWNPDPAPRAAYSTATTSYAFTLDVFGRAVPAAGGAPITTAYQTLQSNGSPLAQQTIANFSTSFALSNNVGATRTDIALAAVGPGAGTIGGAGLAIQSLTLNAFGQVTAAATVAYADPAASFWTSKAESSLGAEVNIGALTSGLLKISVTGGVATPATATPNPGPGASGDYEPPLNFGIGFTRVGNAITNDVVTGIASTAPAWRGSFTSGGSLWIYASTVSPGPLRLVAGSYVLNAIGTGMLKVTSDTIALATAGVDYIASAYQTLQSNGSPLAAQTIANFSTSFALANNVGATRTDVALATVGPGAGTIGGAGLAVQTVTLNAFGQVTAAATVAVEVPLTISTGLTRALNVVTNDVVTGITGTTPAWRGSVTAGGSLTIYASTVSPGALRLIGGSYILNGIGSGLLKATSDTVGLAVAGTDYAAPITAANGSVLYMASGAVTGTPSLFFYDQAQFGLLAYSYDFTQRALAYVGTPPRGINIAGGAHTNMPTAEVVDVKIGLARTVSFVAGNIATMRAVLIDPPTYAFATGSTITTAATLAISGAPGAGANATITNPLALWVQAGAAQFDGGVRTFGLTGTGALVALSISQAANNVSTGGTAKGIAAGFTFAPTSGTAGFNALEVTYTVNQTGGANGPIRGLLINNGPTSVLGTHRLIELQHNGAPRFYIDSASGNIATTIATGMVKSVGGTLATAIPNTDYEPFLAFNTGLSRVINTVTNDVFTGNTSSSVTWLGSKVSGGDLEIHPSSTGVHGALTMEIGGGALVNALNIAQVQAQTATAGVQRSIWAQGWFAPTTGTANFRALALEFTATQAGGANGLIEGLAIRPTLGTINGLFYPINYAPGGTSAWRVEFTGKMWMNQAGVSAVGDIGMSSNGRPRFYHTLAGSKPAATAEEPIIALSFSGEFVTGQVGGGSYEEQCFGNHGIVPTATPNLQGITLAPGGADKWDSGSYTAFTYTQRQCSFPLFNGSWGSLKLRELNLLVMANLGDGVHTPPDYAFSLYHDNGTLTEVARITVTAGSLAITSVAQNIAPAKTWGPLDRVMVTCRNTSLWTGSGNAAVKFAIVARFDTGDS